MYPNLNAEMARKGLKRKDLARIFKGRIPSVSEKLNGKARLYLDEACQIRDEFFPEHSLDYLIEKDKNKSA